MPVRYSLLELGVQKLILRASPAHHFALLRVSRARNASSGALADSLRVPSRLWQWASCTSPCRQNSASRHPRSSTAPHLSAAHPSSKRTSPRPTLSHRLNENMIIWQHGQGMSSPTSHIRP